MNNLIKDGVLLNAQQIFECNKKLEEYSILNRGMKEFQEETVGTTVEERKSDNTIKSLYDLLKIERVYLVNKRARGIYESDKNRVKIISLVGKLVTLGYVEDNIIYLKPHEALLLMEMNRLEVTFDTIVMSIEQAYGMFLSDNCELGLEEYTVFSYISRIGYFIMIHDAKYDKEKYELMEERKKINKEDEMIWSVLMEKLNMPFSRDIIESDYELYLKTKNAMEKCSTAIGGRREEDFESKNESQKTEPPQKKFKAQNIEDENFLDILKTELEYLTYRDIFDKFSYITKKEFNQSDYENSKELKFTFDLFLPKANFKRTENLANYRLLVLKATDKFPTNIQLQNLRESQRYEIPIIIAVVSESMTAHFSICTF